MKINAEQKTEQKSRQKTIQEVSIPLDSVLLLHYLLHSKKTQPSKLNKKKPQQSFANMFQLTSFVKNKPGKTASGYFKVWTWRELRWLRFPERPLGYPNPLHINSKASEHVWKRLGLVTKAFYFCLLKVSSVNPILTTTINLIILHSACMHYALVHPLVRQQQTAPVLYNIIVVNALFPILRDLLLVPSTFFSGF